MSLSRPSDSVDDQEANVSHLGECGTQQQVYAVTVRMLVRTENPHPDAVAAAVETWVNRSDVQWPLSSAGPVQRVRATAYHDYRFERA